MKLNKHKFWIISLSISLISCFLFASASNELFSDFDYRQTLNLPSNADSIMIPIAGGIVAAFLTAIVHIIVHLIFRVILKRNPDIQFRISFKIGKQVNRLQNIILVLVYSICIYWIIDYLPILKIKFYLFNTVFYSIAIMTTLIYGWWILNLFNKRQLE